MTNSDLQLIPCDWLLIGFRVAHGQQRELIKLCRNFDGSVVFRDGEAMLLEFGAYPEVLNEVIARLPKKAVTHFWRSGPATVSGHEPDAQRQTHFCGI